MYMPGTNQWKGMGMGMGIQILTSIIKLDLASGNWTKGDTSKVTWWPKKYSSRRNKRHMFLSEPMQFSLSYWRKNQSNTMHQQYAVILISMLAISHDPALIFRAKNAVVGYRSSISPPFDWLIAIGRNHPLPFRPTQGLNCSAPPQQLRPHSTPMETCSSNFNEESPNAKDTRQQQHLILSPWCCTNFYRPFSLQSGSKQHSLASYLQLQPPKESQIIFLQNDPFPQHHISEKGFPSTSLHLSPNALREIIHVATHFSERLKLYLKTESLNPTSISVIFWRFSELNCQKIPCHRSRFGSVVSTLAHHWRALNWWPSVVERLRISTGRVTSHITDQTSCTQVYTFSFQYPGDPTSQCHDENQRAGKE